MDPVADRELVAHLLRRFGLGASQAELDHYGAEGYEGAVQRLLDGASDDAMDDDGFGVPLERLANPQGNIPLPLLPAWWLFRLTVTRHPLRERLALFWHDHFATSAQKVDVLPAMAQHLQTLRRHALAPFPTLLTEVARDPAMLYWLDNQDNVRGKPNENFARELLELFTLGVDQYTEFDVQETARAFTGWTFGQPALRRTADKPRRGARFFVDATRHDDGRKSILGQAGPWGGDDVLGQLADHPQTARHLVGKLCAWFVYPKPEPALVERLTGVYRASGLDTRVLVREIMLSPEFRSAKARRAVYKNPVDFTVATYRQLGVGRGALQRLEAAGDQPARVALGPILLMANAAKSMGMELLFPPDVAGWEGGASWISSATMVERLKWADRLFGPRRANFPTLQLPAAEFFGEARTPAERVALLVDLFDAPLPPEKVRQLEAAAAADPAPAAAALAVTRLIFGSPEFQFC